MSLGVNFERLDLVKTKAIKDRNDLGKVVPGFKDNNTTLTR